MNIADCKLPIADLFSAPAIRTKSEIGNRKSAI